MDSYYLCFSILYHYANAKSLYSDIPTFFYRHFVFFLLGENAETKILLNFKTPF
jgi:hypothetical protein